MRGEGLKRKNLMNIEIIKSVHNSIIESDSKDESSFVYSSQNTKKLLSTP